MPKIGEYQVSRSSRDMAQDVKEMLRQELVTLPEEPENDYFSENEIEPDYFG